MKKEALMELGLEKLAKGGKLKNLGKNLKKVKDEAVKHFSKNDKLYGDKYEMLRDNFKPKSKKMYKLKKHLKNELPFGN